MLDQYSIKALTPSASWIKISKQQLFYQWQLLNYWVGKLWLQITVMEVLWAALRERCIQPSTLLYHIKKFLAGSKAIRRLSKRVKKSRVSSTISIAFRMLQFWKLFCTVPKKWILILQGRVVPLRLPRAAEHSESTARTPPGLPWSLRCHMLWWLLKANSSSCNQIPSTSNPFAQPVSLAMEFLIFYPN